MLKGDKLFAFIRITIHLLPIEFTWNLNQVELKTKYLMIFLINAVAQQFRSLIKSTFMN